MKFKDHNCTDAKYSEIDAFVPGIKYFLYNNYEDWYEKNILKYLNKKTAIYFNNKIRKALISSKDLFICSDFDGIFSTGNSFYGQNGKTLKEVKPYDPEALKILIYLCKTLNKKIYLSFITDDMKGKGISKSRINDLITNLSKFCKDLKISNCAYITYNTPFRDDYTYMDLIKADDCAIFNSIEEYNSRSFIFDYSLVPTWYKKDNEILRPEGHDLLPEVKRRVTLIKYLYNTSEIANEDSTIIFFGDSISDISSSIILGNCGNREFVFFYKNGIFDYNYNNGWYEDNNANTFPDRMSISMFEISSLSDGIYKLIHLILKFV